MLPSDSADVAYPLADLPSLAPELDAGVIVTFRQRFGGALNLNVHFHALMLDAVFAPGSDGVKAFCRTPSLTALDVMDVLATVEALVARQPWLR